MKLNVNLNARVLVYMLNSRREAVPHLYEAGHYNPPRVHEQQPHYVVNVSPIFETMAMLTHQYPAPPVPPLED